MECVECIGGGLFISALAPVLVLCGLLYLFVVTYLLHSAARTTTNNNALQNSRRAKKVNQIFGQGKILLSLVQIIASIPTVLSGVEFPPFFLQVANIFGIFNFDVLSLSRDFSEAFGCSMSVRFFDRFIIHLLLPILCLLAIGLAIVTAEPIYQCCCKNKRKKNTSNNMSEAIFKVIVLVILLLFPGLSTKLFSMFNCKKFDGVEDKILLVQDYAVECNRGEHVKFTLIAWIFLGLYIIGIPTMMWCSLYCNKKHLHDVKSKRHHLVKVALGGLYWQCELFYIFVLMCSFVLSLLVVRLFLISFSFFLFVFLFLFVCILDEPNLWWFELMILLNKTLMCGGLVLLAPGSPSQILCGILIMLFHLCLVLLVTPYLNYSEDLSSGVSALGLTLIYICALVKMLENSTDDDLSYIDTLLEILPILCVVAVILIMVFMDCKRLCCCKKKQEKGKGKRKGKEKKKGLEVGEKEVEVVENFSGGAKIVPVLTDQTVSSDTPPATGNDLPIIRRNSRRDRPSIKSEPSEFK